MDMVRKKRRAVPMRFQVGQRVRINDLVFLDRELIGRLATVLEVIPACCKPLHCSVDVVKIKLDQPHQYSDGRPMPVIYLGFDNVEAVEQEKPNA